jgi:hypothetical protein
MNGRRLPLGAFAGVGAPREGLDPNPPRTPQQPLPPSEEIGPIADPTVRVVRSRYGCGLRTRNLRCAAFGRQ